MTTWHIAGVQPLGGEPVDIVISEGIISAIVPVGSTPATHTTVIHAQ